MSKQLLQTLRFPSSRSILAPTLRLTNPLLKNSCIITANQLRTFQSSVSKDFQYTTYNMSGTQPASGGEQRNFSRNALFDLSGKVALVTGMCCVVSILLEYVD
jgi:hypothetical protein